MIAIKGMKMPKNCVECNDLGLQEALDCRLIYSGCANCGRHPDCPLVEIVTCKDCKYNYENSCDFDGFGIDDDYFCANGERRK